MQEGLVRELYERFGHHVYARCVYLLGSADEARDASQEVFVKVLQNIGRFRAEASPATWILRIATHHCLNVRRARGAKWREQLSRDEQARERLDHGADGVERRQLVRALLDQVAPEVQQVAVHYFVDEMTQEEIAAAMGRSLPTVRKRLREFLEKARGALGALEQEAKVAS